MIVDYAEGMETHSGTPCVVRGMPESVYFATDALSQSAMKAWARSIEDGVYGHEFDSDKSRAATVGSAVHCRLLDGDAAFNARYMTGGPINPRTEKMYGRETKKFSDWLDEQPDGLVYLTESEYESVCLMVESVRRDRFASGLAAMPGGERELSLFWTETIDGVEIRCKARIDWFNPQVGVVDLKTTNDVSYDGFARSVVKFAWHLQAFWYRRAIEKTGLAPDGMSWGWLVVQNTAPYRIALYHPSDEIIGTGKVVASDAIKNYVRHKRDGITFEQQTGFRSIDIPKWAKANEFEYNEATGVLG